MTTVYPFLDRYVKDKHDPKARKKRSDKASKYVWMTFYYSAMSIYGYIVLKDSAWLPDYMGGKGSWEGMWKGMPYIEPCKGATTYAMISSMTLANFLPIGCVIAFLHDASDIPV